MGMSDPKVVERKAHVRMSSKLRRMATAIHGPKFSADIGARLLDAKVVDAVAQAIERAFEAGLRKDGRIDFREAAICMISEMRRNQL